MQSLSTRWKISLSISWHRYVTHDTTGRFEKSITISIPAKDFIQKWWSFFYSPKSVSHIVFTAILYRYFAIWWVEFRIRKRISVRISMATHTHAHTAVTSEGFRSTLRLGLCDHDEESVNQAKGGGSVKGRAKEKSKRGRKEKERERGASCEFWLQRSNRARSYNRPSQPRMRTAKVRRNDSELRKTQMPRFFISVCFRSP